MGLSLRASRTHGTTWKNCNVGIKLKTEKTIKNRKNCVGAVGVV